MPRLSVFPSKNLPRYFNMDLASGSPEAHPIIEALDECLFDFFILAQKKIAAVQPSLFSRAQQRKVLEYQGFATRTLSDASCEKLYYLKETLFASVGKIESIKQLAEVYFGPAKVQKGLPWPKQKWEQGTKSIRLCDTDDFRRIILVRPNRLPSERKILDFISSSEALLPQPFQVQVMRPFTAKKKKVSWKLTKQKFQERRI